MLPHGQPQAVPGEARDDAKSGYDSSSSDVDLFTEDLDQIGRFNISRFSDIWSKDSFPSLPTFSPLAGLPNMSNLTLNSLPNLSNLPTLSHLAQLPHLPNLPNLPTGATLPSFDLPNVSRYISTYVKAATSRASGSAAEDTHLVNSLKTALATRIQMNTFLGDLRGGLSLQAAIDRLQPLTDIVHEAITLPADDDSDDEPERDTEPVGVAGIVNREQPLVNELVLPDGDEIGGVLDPTTRKSRHRHRRSYKRAGSVFLDEYDSSMANTGSDWDTGEITREEARVLTHLDSLNDFYKEDLLRRKIQDIQGLDSLSQQLKNKLVTKLMMGNYYKYINEKLMREKGVKLRHEGSLVLEEPQLDDMDLDMAALDEEDSMCSDDEVVLTEEDQRPSYHNVDKRILGCPHYQRNCKLECPTCLKWFPCRFCHDLEVADHKLQRSEVKHILCMHCNAPQVPDSNYCVDCDRELANYFCPKCVLYDNDPAKDIYHCDKCGICRLGLGLSKDYFHCDTCNICLSIDLKEHHKCVTNTTHCNCPICNDYLFTSVSKVVFMKCGHLIHELCYDEMIKHSYKCPICKKTVVNAETQFRILDQEIRQQPLPAPYNMWRCIISCNDCKGKSNCAYHVMGLKCKYCQSYNTNQLKLIKPEEAEEKEQELDGDTENERIASMRLIRTNLSLNFVIDEINTETNTEYEGDYNEDADEDEPVGSIVNFKRLTKAILGDKEVERSSITEVFQSFINTTVMSRASDDEMR